MPNLSTLDTRGWRARWRDEFVLGINPDKYVIDQINRWRDPPPSTEPRTQTRSTQTSPPTSPKLVDVDIELSKAPVDVDVELSEDPVDVDVELSEDPVDVDVELSEGPVDDYIELSEAPVDWDLDISAPFIVVSNTSKDVVVESLFCHPKFGRSEWSYWRFKRFEL